MPATWIVLLEAAKESSSVEVDKQTLSRLLEAVADASPVALHCPERYAVQLELPAGSAEEALASALTAWSRALQSVRVLPWEHVRAEVTTKAEFDAEAGLAADVKRHTARTAGDALNAAFDELVSGLAPGSRWHADGALASDMRWRLLLQGSREVLTILSADERVLLSVAPPGIRPLIAQDGAATTLPDEAHPEDAEVVKDALGAALASPGEFVGFVARFGGSDEWAWYESVATNLLDEPMVGAIVVNSRDTTEKKRLEQRLAEMAIRDELTGLVNRTAFLDQIEMALARSSATSDIALFFVDIDDYRGFVDRHGTSAGEKLLVSVARRLENEVQDSARAARLGGDEFALLCEGVSDSAEVIEIAKCIATILNAPIESGNDEFAVTVSVGVAVGTSGMHQPATLLRHAEVAMYRARRGQQHFHVYRKHRKSHSNADTPPPP